MRIDHTHFTKVNDHLSASLRGARVIGASGEHITRDRADIDMGRCSARQDLAARSAQDALAMIRAADSSIAELESIVVRMRALAMHAASDTATYADRLAAQRQIDAHARDVDRIASTAQFGGKSLLDGTSSAIWSSDRLTTRAIVNGVIRRRDGSSAQGNYRITIDLIAPGVAETQQAGAFRIKVPAGAGTDGPGGPGVIPAPKDNVIAYNMPKGDFSLRVFEHMAPDWVGDEGRSAVVYAAGAYTLTNEAGKISGVVTEYYGNRQYKANRSQELDNRGIFKNGSIDTIDLDDGSKMNVQLYFEAIEKNDAANTVTFDVKAHGMSEWADNVDFDGMQLIATTGGLMAQRLDDIGIVVGDGFLSLGVRGASRFEVGDSFVLSIAAGGYDVEGILIEGKIDRTWDESWDAPEFWLNGDYRLFGSAFAINPNAITEGRDPVHFRAFYLNSENGTLYDGDLVVQFGQHMFDQADEVELYMEWGGMLWPLPEFTHLIIAQFRSENIDEPEPEPSIQDGTFDEIVLTDDTLLTVSLGSGESAQIRLYKSDTVGSIADKLNDAVMHLVESKGYDPDSFGHRFVEFMRDHSFDDVELDDGSKVLYGHYTFRTPLPGEDGRIVVAGPDDFMQNFDLTVKRAAEESRFSISVFDAHTGIARAEGVQVTGTKAIGLLHDNVDVKFDPLTDTVVEWNDEAEGFRLRAAEGSSTTYVHLADRTTAYAVGDPTAADMKFSVGDLSADSLGISGLIVTTRREASRALSRLDAVLGKIKNMRARLDASASRMSATATYASSGLPEVGERLDQSGAERMLALMRQTIIARADVAVPAAANQRPARIAALAAISGARAA